MTTDDERREVARSCDSCEYLPVCSVWRRCGDSAWCCSTYKKRIDRNALLELTDAMEGHASDVSACRNSVDSRDLMGYASRIREALGGGGLPAVHEGVRAAQQGAGRITDGRTE